MGLVGAIESKRREAVEQILQMLNNLVESLCTKSGCNPQCSSMLLGYLIRQMHAAGIFTLPGKGTLHDYSLDWLNKTVSGFSSPEFNTAASPFGTYSSPHFCRLQHRVQPALDEILQSVKDIKLEEMGI